MNRFEVLDIRIYTGKIERIIEKSNLEKEKKAEAKKYINLIYKTIEEEGLHKI